MRKFILCSAKPIDVLWLNFMGDDPMLVEMLCDGGKIIGDK